jgi:signal transduction histidine kinase/PAS domain-containing protein
MTTRKRPVVREMQAPTQQQMLEATFDALAGALVVVDRTGRVLRTNRAFRTLFGITTADDYLDLPLAERMQRVAIADAAGTPLPPDRWPLTRVLRGERLGGADEPDVRMCALDGREMRLAPTGGPLIAPDGTITGAMVIYQDVTLQRATEAARDAALAQTEAERRRLATLLSVLPAGVAIYSADGRLVDQNTAAERITGRSVTDAVGSAPMRQTRYRMRRLDGTPLPEPETPSGRARRGEAYADLACVISDPEGQDVDLLTSGAPLRDETGAVTGGVVIFQDVTRLRALEREAQAQRALAESIIDTTPFGLILFDTSDDFICQRSNAPYLELLNADVRARGTAVGLPLAALVEAEDAVELTAIFRRVRDTGEAVLFEAFPATIAKETQVRWYRWSLAPLLNEQGQVIVLVSSAIEVTEQVLARQAVQQQAVATQGIATELEGIFAALTNAVIVFDAAGRITRLNPVAAHLYEEAGGAGFAQEPMNVRAQSLPLADGAGRLLPPERWPGARVLAGETIVGEDVCYHTQSGQERVLSLAGVPLRDATGAVVGGITMYQDVTTRRALEQRTHSTLEALLRMAQQAVGAGSDLAAVTRGLADLAREVLGCDRVGVMAVDPATQIIRAISVAGLSPAEEKQWWAMQPEDARYGDGGDPDEAARFAAGEAFIIDMTQPPYNEQPNPFNITVALYVPIRLSEQLIGMLSLDYGGAPHTFTPQEIALAQGVADLAGLVMERERLQRAAATAQAEAQVQTTLNERMQTFLGIAGHELRTPVTSIKSSVQLTARAVRQALDVALPQPLQQRLARSASLLESADAQADKLRRFIADLLDVTRIQTGTWEMHHEDADLGEIVRQGIASVQPAWPNRELLVTRPATPIPLWADADRIEQVVTNLVTNALKYSTEDQPVAVALTVEQTHARLSVTDHGPGLTPAQQAQLFQAFGRVPGIERQTGGGVGLGLGLFICRTIIAEHSGTIGVQSAPGEGSTFWFTVPLASSNRDAAD